MAKKNIIHHRGFTLIEAVVTIAIISVLFLAFERLFVVNFKSYQTNKIKLDTTDQSLRAYDHLTPELRAASQILTCEANSISFYYLKGDVLTPPQKITVSLNTDQRQIIQSVIDPVGAPPTVQYPDSQKVDEIISESVSNDSTRPLFKYYDGSGAELTAPCNTGLVRMIGVDLLHKGLGANAPAEIESQTKIELRNLKDNL